MDDWERQETGAGIPYYVRWVAKHAVVVCQTDSGYGVCSHRLEKTQWDHPEMVAIMDKLTSFNDIKYAAYRTGAKLICLQKELLREQHCSTKGLSSSPGVHPVPTDDYHAFRGALSPAVSNVHVSMLPGVFGCRGLEGSGQQELLLGCSQAEAVLEELYRRAPGVHQQKVPLLAALALNLLQNLFDAKRKGTIQVVQMKVALFVLCAGRLLDKLKYMCGELQDGSQRIPLEGLEAFLHNISKVPELLGEKLSFGAHLVPAAVESCRKVRVQPFAGHRAPVTAPFPRQLCSQPSVPSDLFLGWLLREPQNLVWISTFYRMRSTENGKCPRAPVAHPVKCGACKASPVVGLRYQCLQCLGYDLCQSCFLHGMISKNHSIKHRMQEHCQQVGDATGRNVSVALEASDVSSIRLDCTISPLAELAVAVSVPDSCPRCRNPLVSLCRYQCLQCLGYDLCQSCFLHGMISKNHSIKHRMQEHCQQVGDATGRYASVTEEALEASDVPSICLDCIISPLAEHTVATSSWEKVKAVLKTLSLKLQRWKREPRPSYLPLQAAEPRHG
ncbi:dystrophin, putative [Ixodes scapularis]|uniref:Dystrophin, putative n=1 Tax=Ixodes scapularis TaxID=6945 RepID=B7PND6_IXOSC|nr:dystrophin, putative [Ixodes scapularis]|eukprot:XP_002435276.1 dystrophin, putative [Ixodes scapularis]